MFFLYALFMFCMHMYIYTCNDMPIVHIYFCNVYAQYACDVQYFFYLFPPSAPKGKVQTNSYIGAYSAKWEYWFKPMGKNQRIITCSYSIPFIHRIYAHQQGKVMLVITKAYEWRYQEKKMNIGFDPYH